jgi:hypothetical protein
VGTGTRPTTHENGVNLFSVVAIVAYVDYDLSKLLSDFNHLASCAERKTNMHTEGTRAVDGIAIATGSFLSG